MLESSRAVLIQHGSTTREKYTCHRGAAQRLTATWGKDTEQAWAEFACLGSGTRRICVHRSLTKRLNEQTLAGQCCEDTPNRVEVQP